MSTSSRKGSGEVHTDCGREHEVTIKQYSVVEVSLSSEVVSVIFVGLIGVKTVMQCSTFKHSPCSYIRIEP